MFLGRTMWRLQKILAHAGVRSRRKSEELILQGRVTVNGKLSDQLGTKADPTRDEVRVDGVLLLPEGLEYFILNKPRGVISAASDDRGRPVVTQLVPSKGRLYPAGRLDIQSEGLILLTNDGDLAKFVTCPGTVEKVYQVKVGGYPSVQSIQRLQGGVRVAGHWMSAQRIRLLKHSHNSWYEVALLQGRNRQIRFMFQYIGHPVMKLRRVAIGSLSLGKLAPGQYRELLDWEIRQLKLSKGKVSPFFRTQNRIGRSSRIFPNSLKKSGGRKIR